MKGKIGKRSHIKALSQARRSTPAPCRRHHGQVELESRVNSERSVPVYVVPIIRKHRIDRPSLETSKFSLYFSGGCIPINPKFSSQHSRHTADQTVIACDTGDK
jgi:hypothetical protein